MKTVNDHGLKFAFFVGRVPPAPLTATFVVKAGFKLSPDGVAELLPEDQQPEFSGDAFNNDDAAQGLRYASDFALFKPGADLLLAGHCHAPEGQLLSEADVVFGVGDSAKRLVVFGDRFWMKDGLGAVMSEPLPFASVPLTWGRSFGGPEDPRNPAGRGAGETAREDGTPVHMLPNIESLRSPTRSPRDRPDPVGFGPIDPASSQRASKTGTYDQLWLEQHWPWLPADFDWTFFNAAPLDQQLEGRFLRGDEVLRFDNMHPQFASYRCRLAAVRVRLFVKRRRGTALLFEEVPVGLDTLFADMDAETVTLVWRGIAAADSMKLKEFEEVFVLMEPLSRRLAADLAGYERLYSARQAEIVAADALELQPLDPVVVVPPRLPTTAWADRLREEVAALPSLLPDDAAHPMDEEWRRVMGTARPLGTMPPAPVVRNLAEGEALIRAELARLEAVEPGVAKVFSNVPLDFSSIDKEIEQDEKNMTPGANDEIPDEPEDGEGDEWTRERVKKHVAAGGTFDGQDLSGLDLSHLDLSGLSFREALLDGAQLVGCAFDSGDFSDASLTKAVIAESTFRNCNLKNADLSEAVAPDSTWQGSNLTGAEFEGANLAGANFQRCRGKYAGFSGCDLTRADFEGCELEQPDFTAASLAGGSFRNAVLPDAGFYKILAAGANFEGAQIPRGRFNDAQAVNGNFTRCLLDEGVLENARLAKANFTQARLARAIFTGASLSQAMFLRADCVNAKFDDAVAPGGRFVQTNLFRATFENADLTGAAFLGSNCYEAEFFQVIVKDTVFDDTNLKGTKLA
jgi:uncharacterized protein YjbI with pentapeptide repeats